MHKIIFSECCGSDSIKFDVKLGTPNVLGDNVDLVGNVEICVDNVQTSSDKAK